GYVAVAGFYSPLAGHRRSRAGTSVDPAVAGFKFEYIEAAIGRDVPVAGTGAEPPVDSFNALRPIATAHVHFAFEVADLDFAVSGVKIDLALARHVNVDVHAVIANVEGNAMMGVAHVDFNRIAVLVLVYLQSTFTYFVPRADYGRFDGVLVPGFDVDI